MPAPAINRYLLPAERPTANSLYAAAAADRWDRQIDRQTDRQTPDRHIDPAWHTMRTVSMTVTELTSSQT